MLGNNNPTITKQNQARHNAIPPIGASDVRAGAFKATPISMANEKNKPPHVKNTLDVLNRFFIFLGRLGIKLSVMPLMINMIAIMRL